MSWRKRSPGFPRFPGWMCTETKFRRKIQGCDAPLRLGHGDLPGSQTDRCENRRSSPALRPRKAFRIARTDHPRRRELRDRQRGIPGENHGSRGGTGRIPGEGVRSRRPRDRKSTTRYFRGRGGIRWNPGRSTALPGKRERRPYLRFPDRSHGERRCGQGYRGLQNRRIRKVCLSPRGDRVLEDHRQKRNRNRPGGTGNARRPAYWS